MNTTWKDALRNKRFAVTLVVILLSLLLLAFFMPVFFGNVIADKQATRLNDFILDLFNPYDWSWTIFTLIYSTIVLTIITNYSNVRITMIGLATYSGVTWLRMLTIYLFTLDPPSGMIFLKDPFLSLIVYPGEFAKDLFFSGHVSSMVVCILIEPKQSLKYLKIATTVAVGILLMAQHVHYSIDVMLAPLFTYLVYRWANHLVTW